MVDIRDEIERVSVRIELFRTLDVNNDTLGYESRGFKETIHVCMEHHVPRLVPEVGHHDRNEFSRFQDPVALSEYLTQSVEKLRVAGQIGKVSRIVDVSGLEFFLQPLSLYSVVCRLVEDVPVGGTRYDEIIRRFGELS